MRVLVVTAMYPSPERPYWGTFVKDQVESLRQAGVDVEVFTFGKSHNLGYLSAIRVLNKHLKNNTYDLIHAHYGLTGVVACAQTKCPVVMTYHGGDLLNHPSYNNQSVIKVQAAYWISWLVGYACVERIVVADLLKPKLWPHKTVTLAMGLDMDKFQPTPKAEARRQLGLAQDKQFVLFPGPPGHLRKRYDVAHAAVDILQEKRPNVELLPLIHIPHDQVPLYMSACDVLTVMSMYEASPMVVKEAMACNLPVVSVDVGDVAQRIDGVDLCYLCERVPSDVADKLDKVLAANRRAESRAAIADFSLPNIAQKLIGIYETVLAA